MKQKTTTIHSAGPCIRWAMPVVFLTMTVVAAHSLLAGTTYVDNISVSNTFVQAHSETTNRMYGALVLKRQGDVLMGDFTSGVTCAEFLSIVSLSPANIAGSNADMRGELLDVGGENPLVELYWGTNDGAQVKGNWSCVTGLGVRAAGMVTTNIGGLTTNVLYYYRHYASNTFSEAWSTGSIAFTPYANDGSVVTWGFSTSNNPTEDSGFLGTNTGALAAGGTMPTWIASLASTSACYYFDGGDRINAGHKSYFSFGNQSNNCPVTNDLPFTVMAWVKPEVSQSYAAVVAKHWSGSDAPYDWTLWGAFGGVMRPTVNIYSTNGYYLEVRIEGGSTDPVLSTSVWTHITAVIAPTGNIATANDIQLYTNGILPRSVTRNTPALYLGMAQRTNAPLCIGLSMRGFWGWIGNIDDFRLYTNALSQAQIQSIVNTTTNGHPIR